MLDDQGHVKLGDLGLVKTPATRRHDDSLSGQSSDSSGGLNSLPHDMTGARIALGTPAYMSPEQCRDAANVDHRADIYSLGCTLYVLVTGRQPFDGTTAVELMTKHAYEPLVPPEHIVARVPKEVSDVIQRMMAKDADDRFQSMGEVIRTLECWLGIQRAGTFTPHDEQISGLESYVHQFNHAPTAAVRRRVLTGFFAAVALSAVLIAFFGKLAWAFGVVGMMAQASLAYFILDGLARHGHLFVRTRRFVFGLAWGDWAIGIASLALFCILLAMLDVIWIWTGFGLIGLGLAFALRYGLDRTAEEEQSEPIEACERLLRRLRTQGLDEEEIQHFVAKFAGREWEGFFEALFGYEAKLAARAVLLRGGAGGSPREARRLARAAHRRHGPRREVAPGRPGAETPAGRRACRVARRRRNARCSPKSEREPRPRRWSARPMTSASRNASAPPNTPRPACPLTSMFTRPSWPRGRESVRVPPEPETRPGERVCEPLRRRARSLRARGRTHRSVRLLGPPKPARLPASRRHGSLEIAGVPGGRRMGRWLEHRRRRPAPARVAV